MHHRRALAGVVIGAVLLAVAVPVAQAGPVSAELPVEASTTNPLAGCPPDGDGINFPDSEVEPWVEVNPTDGPDGDDIVGDNIAGFYQQDRYSNGGAKSNVAAVSLDGGDTWTRSVPNQLTTCTAGPNAPFQRASDPWMSFGPTGTLHAMSLVLDPDPPGGGFGDNGMVYNRSTDGGLTWGPPVTLRVDTDPRFLNDKNSITADPTDAGFVYAVWDRLQTARGEIQSSPQGAENVVGLGFKGPVWFARTTNNGLSWEPAREIYSPSANNQTIGNQIVVQPDGTVYDFFNETLVRPGFRALLSFITSDDHGVTWDAKATRVAQIAPMDRVREDGVIDREPNVVCPDPGDQGACPIRTADILFDVAVHPGNGNLYAVWQDARFDGFTHDSIAFTQSTNGGATWSTPIEVNATPEDEPIDDQQAFIPSVHVDGAGRVVVTYYDFRNNTPDDGILGTDKWAVHCHAACQLGTSWPGDGEDSRVTPATFDMRDAPFARGWFVGDYVGLDDDGTDFISFFSQTHGESDTSAFSSRLSIAP
jgi:hypothetical protein